jgi:hypothetical protein
MKAQKDYKYVYTSNSRVMLAQNVGLTYICNRPLDLVVLSTTKIFRFSGFRLTQYCFNSCLLFYSNYPLHVSVVRPSSRGNIYIGN